MVKTGIHPFVHESTQQAFIDCCVPRTEDMVLNNNNPHNNSHLERPHFLAGTMLGVFGGLFYLTLSTILLKQTLLLSSLSGEGN